MKEEIIKLAAGNPGALNVIISAPDNLLSLLVTFLSAWNITGSRIWVLYKNICKGDYDKIQAIMWAVETMRINPVTLLKACEEDFEAFEKLDIERIFKLYEKI